MEPDASLAEEPVAREPEFNEPKNVVALEEAEESYPVALAAMVEDNVQFPIPISQMLHST